MTGAAVIRTAESADGKAICAIEKAYIGSCWTQQMIDEAIADEKCLFLVAEIDGMTVGYLSGVFAADECDVSNIAVAEAHRRRGIATALFERLFEGARTRGAGKVFLYVRNDNGSAHALYEKLGFTEVGLRKGYYGDADAVVMRRDL